MNKRQIYFLIIDPSHCLGRSEQFTNHWKPPAHLIIAFPGREGQSRKQVLADDKLCSDSVSDDNHFLANTNTGLKGKEKKTSKQIGCLLNSNIN